MLAWQNGTKEYILPQLNIGVAYTANFKQLQIIPAMDWVNLFYPDPAAWIRIGDWSQYFHVGTEIDYMKRLAVRAGFFRGQMTAGAGLRIAFTQVDYCFSKHMDLGNSHLISLTLQKPKTIHP
jgi:hypothetical protein